jgi:hypothetical protein
VSPLVRPGRSAARAVAAWVGWGLIGLTLATFAGDTPFPGIAAALPVVGTLLVIWAGYDRSRFSPNSLTGNRVVQYVGDISYSLYLWHWPLIVLLPLALNTSALSTALKIGIVVGSVVLATVSKYLIEDPVRSGIFSRSKPVWSFVAMTAAMAIVVAGSSTAISYIDNRAVAETALATDLIDSDEPCFGARIIDAEPSECDASAVVDLIIPSTATATKDRSPTWDECAAPGTEAVECVLGVEGGTRVAVIGDSHAHHWITAVEKLAEQEKWEIHLFVKGRCPFSQVEWQRKDRSLETSCTAWNADVDATLEKQTPFSLVITSMRASSNQTAAGSDEDIADGFRASWKPLIDRGATIVAIRDVPGVLRGTKTCVETSNDPSTECYAPIDEVLEKNDYLYEAARITPGAIPVDLTAHICIDGRCPAVIGGVLVNRDLHHLTATYATTLAPDLLAAIEGDTSSR